MGLIMLQSNKKNVCVNHFSTIKINDNSIDQEQYGRYLNNALQDASDIVVSMAKSKGKLNIAREAVM